MDNNIILSLCIPTYNRCKYLKKSIESVINQKTFIDGLVEIVVSDNASTDDTYEICKEFTDKYENIKYYRNVTNIMDRNFPLALSRGTGKLRKLCNDTHIYRHGAVDYICDLFNKFKEDKPLIYLANGSIDASSGKYDFVSAIKLISFNLTAIANLCLWDKDCAEIENNITGCDLNLWQVGKFIELATTGNLIYVDNLKLFDVQFRNKSIPYGLFNVFYNNYLGYIKECVNQNIITKEDYVYLEKDLLFNFFIIWTVRWELNAKNLSFNESEDLKSLVFSVCSQRPYWNLFKARYRITKLIYILTRPIAFAKHKILGR